MTGDRYVPQVGDRIRYIEWVHAWVDVLAVGQTSLFGREGDGTEDIWPLEWDWVKVDKPTPLPERWINVYLYGVGCDYQADADGAATPDRLAVIHLAADGTLTLHRVPLICECCGVNEGSIYVVEDEDDAVVICDECATALSTNPDREVSGG